MQNFPARPDIAPTPKKRSKGAIVASILGGLIVLGALSSLVDSPADTPSEAPTSVTSYEITAQDVVDVMDPSQVDAFCTAYYQLGDYDLALDQFTEGYGSGQDPSAEEVFDELLVRC